jgi:aspartate-semialdehyde dehydrogenase
MKSEKMRAGILGATGAVGIRLSSMLSNHPWFSLTRLMASERSTGHRYGDIVEGVFPGVIDRRITDMTVEKCHPDAMLDIVFSCLPASQANNIEENFANEGIPVVSNSSAHRMDDDVPLIIPEINSDHLVLIHSQKIRRKQNGFIVANPNCSTIALALGLDPVMKVFGINKIMVCTAQAVSGAGYPGLSVMTMLDNAIPYIPDEEPKLESEPAKIFGQIVDGKVKYSDVVVSAGCTRIAVRDGHLMHASFSTRETADREAIRKCWAAYNVNDDCLGLPTSPDYPVKYMNNRDRPQPFLDRDLGAGMTVCVGRLRVCPILNWKCVILGHNTIRGAAGGALLLAELLVKKGYIQSEQTV